MANVVPPGTGAATPTVKNPIGPAPTPSGKQTVPIGVIPGPGQTVQPAMVTPADKAAIKSIKPGASHVLLMLAIELLAVGMFTLIAGINNDVGNMVILFMVGLWFIYMITDSKIIAGLGNSLSNVASGA